MPVSEYGNGDMERGNEVQRILGRGTGSVYLSRPLAMGSIWNVALVNHSFCVTLSRKMAGFLDILRPNKGKELTNMAAINTNKEQLQQMMNGDKPVLVDFWAPWCGYCRRIAPAYEAVAEKYGDRLVAAKVNIDEEAQFAEAAQVEVIPTLILYKNGKAVDSIVNPGSKAVIDQFVQEALEK